MLTANARQFGINLTCPRTRQGMKQRDVRRYSVQVGREVALPQIIQHRLLSIRYPKGQDKGVHTSTHIRGIRSSGKSICDTGAAL